MKKTPGQVAYEAELKVVPTYHDSQQRKSWSQLGEVERWSWERNPTPRWIATPRGTLVDVKI